MRYPARNRARGVNTQIAPRSRWVSVSRRIKPPVWDSTVSTIKRPVLLYEGHYARIVDFDDVGDSHDSGREIVVRWLNSEAIRVIDWLNPQEPIQRDLRKVKKNRTVKAAIRISEPPNFRGDISSRMGARQVLKAAAGQLSAKRLFAARRSRSAKLCVTSATISESHHGVILYMPQLGKQTKPEHEILGLKK